MLSSTHMRGYETDGGYFFTGYATMLDHRQDFSKGEATFWPWKQMLNIVKLSIHSCSINNKLNIC